MCNSNAMHRVISPFTHVQIFALQSANIYPILYMILNSREERWRHSTTIWALLTIGTAVCGTKNLLLEG